MQCPPRSHRQKTWCRRCGCKAYVKGSGGWCATCGDQKKAWRGHQPHNARQHAGWGKNRGRRRDETGWRPRRREEEEEGEEEEDQEEGGRGRRRRREGGEGRRNGRKRRRSNSGEEGGRRRRRRRTSSSEEEEEEEEGPAIVPTPGLWGGKCHGSCCNFGHHNISKAFPTL